MAAWATANNGTLIMLEVGENEDLGWDAVGERKRDAPPTLHRADPRPESGPPGRGGAASNHTRATHSRGGRADHG